MKAMILAAGLGRRLKPITDTIPKPLVEVAGKALIEHTIIRLEKAGIREIVCNVSPFKEKIMERLKDGSQFGVHLSYSEEETPLETGGGILKALPLLGKDPFILVSGDIYVDYDFAVLKGKLKNNLIHLVMVKNPHFKETGDWALEENKLIVSDHPNLTYANIGVIDPKIFEGSEPGVFAVAPLFQKAILAGYATGEVFSGCWYNVGTITELNALKAVLEKNG